VWIGTEAGFDGLRMRKVQMLNAADGWQGCAVLSFAVQADGAAWVGTEGAGLYRYEREQWKALGPSSGVINSYIWSVLETRNKELFVGTYGGGLLVRRGDEQFESPGELAKITAPVLALSEGRNGAIYIGTTAGLYRYAAGKLTELVGKDRLELPDVRAIGEGADGSLWFGMSGGGLGSIKDGVLKQFRKADGVGSELVVCLYAEENGTLWIGTSDNGVTRLKHGRFANIGVGQGLPNAIVSHIVDDRLGNLWIGSHAGIVRASKADLNLCADGQIKSVHWLSYGKAEGLASQICSGGFQPGACRAADGRIWFPTAKGLAILDPANVTTNAVPPPVKIEEFVVDSTTLERGAWEDEDGLDAHMSDLKVAPQSTPSSTSIQPLRIPAGRQRFEFRYTGLSFMAPDKVRFKYKLEGLEREWTDAGAKRFAQYSYLPPGDYRFQVIACNNDGVWNNQGAVLAFTVLPFVWQTWWFQLSSLGAGVGAVGAGAFWISRRRIRRRLELSERQSALERERARIARDIHDDLGASLTRITLLSQSVRSEVEGQPEATAEVDQIYDTARQLTRAMDEIVWAVNPKHDTLDSLVTYLGRFAQHFLVAAPIRCRLDVPLNLPPWALTSEVRHNTFLAFKEALNNVVKHAAATEVRVSLELHPNAFVLSIVDNGRGFKMRAGPPVNATELESQRLASGNGLANMKKRMEEIGGNCEWSTSPGEGTRVKLRVLVAA
jgi:signal transduction histidine kinase